jgi:hypothetical protein
MLGINHQWHCLHSAFVLWHGASFGMVLAKKGFCRLLLVCVWDVV